MNQNLKKLLCGCLAVMLVWALAACRSGGGEATESVPAGQNPVPTAAAPDASAPDAVGVEEWSETEEPQSETTDPGRESDDAPAAEEDPIVSPGEPAEDTEPLEGREPAAGTTEPQTGSQEPASMSYAEYMALTPAEQQAFYESFPTLEDFIAWYNAAEAEYDAGQDIPVVTGPIDIGDYIEP